VILSVVLITCNEEMNLERTLKSVAGLVREVGGEIIDVRATQRPIGQTRTEADADASSDVTAWPV